MEFKKLYKKNRNTVYILSGIFLIALLLRFLFFPSNTQFAYDHARDAFVAQQILTGEFKIIGPPTTANPNLNHGALFYYILVPIYMFSGGNPEGLSFFLRVYNALGVFLIFAIGTAIANKRIGLVAAGLYALSFEQTQYALFMGHPTMAVLTTMLFFLGFALLIFRNKGWGLILSAIGFGLSVQFHFGLLYLAPLFVIYPLVFRKYLPKITLKTVILSVLGLTMTTITFLLAELKYNFRTTTGLISLFSEKTGETATILSKLQNINSIINRYIVDNFFMLPIMGLGTILVVVAFLWIVTQKKWHKAVLFLVIWFVWGLVPYYLTGSQIYFYGVGTSISLLVLGAFVMYSISAINKMYSTLFLSLIVISNLWLIITHNPQGPINAITSQDGMLLKDEKQIMDFTYKKAEGKPFAINALTVPYTINTTWSYLYDWYGKKTYGYVPIWGGSHATGFHTALEINTARSTLPEKRFLILEPSQGILAETKENFIKEEETYAQTVNSFSAGLLSVYEQKPRK